MTNPAKDQPGTKCAKCGNKLSLEVGIVNYGPEGDSKLYCQPCSPSKGTGYTLSDIKQWRREEHEAHAVYDLKRKTELMDMLGPDVFFAAGFAHPKQDREPLKRALRTMKAADATLDDLLNGDPS
jgi:hypothetical protein